MMNGLKMPLKEILVGIVICWASTACITVDAVRLTNKNFPPKASPQEVEVLDKQPPCAHIAIARLSVDDSSYANFRDEQDKILDKAASLGADAVVFSKPEKHIQQSVTYSSPMMYGPWGYGMYGYPGWGYGMGGYGMGGYGMMGGMAIPYNYSVKSLQGVAVKYTDPGGPKC